MATKPLTVLGDNGTPVDWWFIYKISRVSQSPTGASATGEEYLYYDSNMAKEGQKPVLSANAIDKSGALFDTYSQLFTADAKANKDLGYYCYNDEDRYEPGTTAGTGPSPCGHCKGALAFDLGTDSAFWLLHSVPLLPMNAVFAYPPTGFKMAQTMLCIQLPNADATKAIAQLMYDAHGPNVNVASDLMAVANDKKNNFSDPPVTNVPGKLGYVAGAAMNDPRLMLMQNMNGSSGRNVQPYSGRVPFTSKGGQQFTAMAKNRAWGDPAMGQPVKDFYNDLVSVVLNENIDVETWENAGPKVPPEVENGEAHKVENMHSVNLVPLGIPWSWAEENDHAKLAISDRNNTPGSPHWVCVGDINFTDSMEKRGGGTVAFICDPLWNALSQVLSAAEEAGAKTKGGVVKIPTKGGKKTAPVPKPTKKAAPAPKPIAKKKAAVKKKAVVAKRKVAAMKRAAKKGVVKKKNTRKAANKKRAMKRIVPKKAVRKKATSKKVAVRKSRSLKPVKRKPAPRKRVASKRRGKKRKG